MNDTAPHSALYEWRCHLGQSLSVASLPDGAVVPMVQGNEIPVSRTNMSAIREAGLLPRS